MVTAKGTRRAEDLIRAARPLSYQESYSYTEGWNDDVCVNILNLGLDKVYRGITELNNPANIEQVSLDVVAGEQAVDIPMDVFMAIRLVDVRYIYGEQWNFIPMILGQIQDRFPYVSSFPCVYCVRNGQMLLSPVPNETRAGALQINYQKRMRSLDIRRGKIASRTTSPVTFTLSFNLNSKKDLNMRAAANSTLDLVDYCCLVDRDGEVIVAGIPLDSYNSNTFVLTADPSYTIPTAQLAALDAKIADSEPVYVVQGDYASTNSQLDRQCEDFLIEFLSTRLLRLSSNAEATPAQMAVEQDVLDSLVSQYRLVRPRTYPITMTGSDRYGQPFGRSVR